MAIFTAATALATTAIGSLFAGGTAAAISTAANVAGLGLKAYSAFSASDAAQEREDLFQPQLNALTTEYEAQNKAADLNSKIERIRDQVNRLDFYRRSREIVRNSREAAANARSAAANQGALFSSSYKGGQAQVLANSIYEYSYLERNRRADAKIISLREDIRDQEAIARDARSEYNLLSLFEQRTQVAQQEAESFGNIGNLFLNNADTIGNLFSGIGGTGGSTS